MARFVFQDKSIHYEEYGAGEPIVVLNGIMMSCGSWAEFVEPFSANNRLILLDMLDQGKSSKMDGPFSQAIQAEVVLALLDELGIEKVSMLGLSYGGEVAQRFAIKYGHRLNRLVLFNTTSRTGPWLGDIGEAWNLAADNAEAYYMTTIPVIYSPGFYREHYTWMEQRHKVLQTVFSNQEFMQAMVRLTNSSSDFDVTDQLDQIQTPTLVVSCMEDYLTPMEEQRRIVERIPNCEYVVIPGCGHASMYEKPVLFAALTLGFINNPKTTFTIV